MLAKLKPRLLVARPENLLLLYLIGCLGLWVAIRCVLEILRNDVFSLSISIPYLIFLACRGWSVAKDKNAHFSDLILFPPTLLWATWVAYRDLDFFMWWLPAILLIVFLASSHLVAPLLSISVMLISITLSLRSSPTNIVDLIVATIAVVSIAAVYRLARDRADDAFGLERRKMELISEAARLLHAEVNGQGELISGSAWLLREVGVSSKGDTLHLRNLIHPSDHSAVMQTIRNAIDLAAIKFAANTTCDCRLLRQDGSVFWVHAQCVRTGWEMPSVVVSFISIDDRLRAEEALRESQRKLVSQSLELSTQFDAAKSTLHARQEVERLAQHDLRAPLKSIEAAAALLRKSCTLSVKEEHLLTSIEKTAARALSMVSMSLDLYRMEEGTFRFIPETIDLVPIGRAVIAELGHHARTKNVRLDFDTEIVGLKAIGNPLLTASVVENLIRNALEAAPEYSAVTIGVYRGKRVGLMIHNEGSVSDSIRDEFFEKYVTHGKRGGLGLGTYSARLIARAQGGDLTMTSSEEKGTLLVFKLQRGCAKSDNNKNTLIDAEKFGPSIPGSLVQLPAFANNQTAQLPLDILIVDDDEYNWLLLLSWLPRYVGLRRAINGREAVEALTNGRPDLVIMDLEMPVMGGFEALYQIRELQAAAGEEPTSIYAFSGYDDVDTIKNINDAGFDGVLSKPLRKDEFDEVLNLISAKSMSATIQGKLWIEKSFIDAFPNFIESRRMLIDEIEQAVRSCDMDTLRRSAHTLSGSLAMHGFDVGISICRRLIAMACNQDLDGANEFIADLRKLLSNPIVR